MSGANDEDGNDPSLILALDGNVLVWKDFTAMMENREATVNKIFGEFRDAYDQFCSKASGKTGMRNYRARFGMIACVTDRIDSFAETHQQLGQRFMSFRLNRIPKTHEQRVKDLAGIVKSMTKKRVWQNGLKAVVQREMNEIIKVCAGHPRPTMSAGAELEVRRMADLLALARTVANDETVTRPEFASRIVQQFINLGMAHAIADGRDKWNESDLQLIRRVFRDSLSLVRQRLLMYLYRQGKHRPSKPIRQLAMVAGCHKHEMKLILRQYLYSGVLEVPPGEHDEPWYRLTQGIYDTIDSVKVLR
jgi:hypothetical protein